MPGNRQPQTPSSKTRSQSLIWADVARGQGITLDAMMSAVAYLGCHGILDELDVLGTEEGDVTDGVKHGWVELWRTSPNPRQDLLKWASKYPKGTRCTSEQRALVDKRGECFDSKGLLPTVEEQALYAAAERLSQQPDQTPHQSFADWFLGEWERLLRELDHQKSRNSRPRLVPQLRAFLVSLAKPNENEQVMIVGDHLAHLVEDAAATWIRHEPGDSANPGFYQTGIRVVTRGLDEELAARVSQIARGLAPVACENIEPLPENCQQTESNNARILDPKKPEGPWNCVIAAPPFGMTTALGALPMAVASKRREHNVLQWSLLSLAEGGRAFILMPRSFCVADGEARQVREWLINNFRLDVVVHLPENCGWAGVNILTTLICVTKDHPRDRILVLDEGFVKRRLMALDQDDPSYFYNRGVLESAIRVRMEVEDFHAGDRESGVVLCTPEEAIENSRLFFYVSIGDERTENLPIEGALPMSGLISRRALARNDYELDFARYNRRRENTLRASLEILVKTHPEVSIVKLADVAELMSGVSYDRKMAVERDELSQPTSANPIGLLRVSDLSRKAPQFGEPLYPREPQLFLREAASQSIREDALLRDGDLLISRVGTVGRINQYSATLWLSGFLDEPDRFRTVASSQIMVVRPCEQISSRFLASLLSSPAYQEWIAARTSGSVISHLKIRDIGDIPVPLAPKHIQAAIAEHLLAGHPLEALADVLSHGPRSDPTLLAFIENPSIREFGKEMDNGRGSEALRALVESLTHRAPSGVLSDWWRRTAGLAEDLLDVMQIADARDRFTAYQVWLSQFSHDVSPAISTMATLQLPGSSESTRETDRLVWAAASRTASEVLDGLKLVAKTELAALLEAIKFEATVSPVSVAVATPAVVTIRLINRSSLSLRDFRVQLDGSSGRSALLVPEATTELPITVVRDSLGTHPLLVEWSAKRMDGQSAKGSIELSLQVVPKNDSENLDLGTNPYVDARTLQGGEDRVFFGRKTEIERILAELRKPSASTVLLIEGNRRTGKTSLLYHFNLHHLPSDWIAAYCTFQSGEGESSGEGIRGLPTREVFYILAEALVSAVVGAGYRLELFDVGAFDPAWSGVELFTQIENRLHSYFDAGHAYQRLRLVLEQCLEAVRPRRLLLEIEEFDTLQEGMLSGATSTQTVENIRHLFQTYNQVAGILTGSRKVRRLREEYWNVLFGIGDPVILSSLDPESARALITLPVERRLRFTPAAVDLIVHLTACQARIIQTLCSRLFDLCAANPDLRVISEEMVERVGDEKARNYEHFKSLWRSVPSAAHRCVALTVNRMELAGVRRITFSQLRDDLIEQGLSPSVKGMEEMLGNLTDLEILGESIQDSTKSYFLQIPLLSRWLLLNADIDQLREEARNEII